MLILPSYGNREARKHWHETLDQTVPFGDAKYRNEMTVPQLVRLIHLHPDGRVHFWGSRASHDSKMAHVRTGDLALFTGDRHVRAIAKIGAIFRNEKLANALWPPKPGSDRWQTVFSLLNFSPTRIPYQELNGILGYKNTFQYPRMILLDGTRAESVWRIFGDQADRSDHSVQPDPQEII